MFLGNSFASSKETLISSAVEAKNIQQLAVKSAVLDEIYVSNNLIDITNFDASIPSDWGFNTLLHAEFMGDLHGGNVGFSTDVVEFIRIKRRLKNEPTFKTIYEKPINKNEDFEIILLDYTEPIGNIEYAYVPVISGGEGNYISNGVESKFESYFICEKDVSYPIILDTAFKKQLNHLVGVVELPNRLKPVVIKGGITNYYSGDMECTFIENRDCQWLIDSSWEYRNQIYQFLTNGRPKILKDFEGNSWMIAITSGISEDSDHHEHVKSKFSVVECGETSSIGDLYDNGFIDTDLDR
ncbi:hypothetical protein [Lacrimispora sp.]|uniref:hypothetical protein n=1 Tax=Lacrimispora sp. TaxID=2719234 RepID=UPI002FD93DA1